MNIFSRNTPGLTEILSDKKIGIAGCGGLGSNVAVALTRAGIGSLVLADFDRVEPSNLNRQHYFIEDIGELKVKALSKYLKKINPDLKIEASYEKICHSNIKTFFSNVNIMVEAFDRAEEKLMLIDYWSQNFPSIPIIAASGVAGIGKNDSLKIIRSGNFYLCGDQKSDSDKDGLCSARVAVVANMQANLALEILCKNQREVQ